MPVTRPGTYPDLAYLATGSDIATPDVAHAGSATGSTTPPASGATGWAEGDVPPRQWFNWFHQWTAKWTRWLDQQVEALSCHGTGTLYTYTALSFRGWTVSKTADVLTKRVVMNSRNFCTVWLPYLTGTSNANYTDSYTAGILSNPPLAKQYLYLPVMDNGSIVQGSILIDTDGTIKYGIGAGCNVNGWTDSGTKEVYPVCMSYECGV